ncbi:hypothetical protein DSM104443_00963 [Usitatibacter rugosus]|uniref:Uncharacterized protein n=1 Tax=Usitatibacter rugosus TaxID=2732067 RepID=A0A6M4GS31_9PROT|nr:hypothetical protein [Usitatibacter rugosus]QJR09912.1 hypothetical protein DSM104443_00963 [Usitatibacter rugosus]
MADPRDDALRQRYRELATEEPSAALDDAIRAAARRAVSSGPGKVRKPGVARWAVPASVAAVLFLSFSVVMRLEKEAPPIAEPTPSSIVASKESAPSLAFAPKEAPASSSATAPVETAKEQALSRDKLREQPRMAAPPALQKEKKDAVVVETKPAEVLADSLATAKPEPARPAASVAPPSPAPASPPPAVASVPATESARAAGTTANSAPQAAMVPAPARVQEEQRSALSGRRDEAAGALGATQQPRAKAESYAEKRVAEDVAAPWPDTPEKKLERIEALRKANRDKEADDAIARFRREHPDYRIPDATWERIRPR